MEELKVSDLFKGKMGIFMLLLVMLSVVLVALKIAGTLAIGYDIALFPFMFDLIIIAVFMVAKFL